MTIRQIINAMNSHPEIWVTIWNARHDTCVYIGHYDRLTPKMLDWEVEYINIQEMITTASGLKLVATVEIGLEYGAEFR